VGAFVVVVVAAVVVGALVVVAAVEVVSPDPPVQAANTSDPTTGRMPRRHRLSIAIEASDHTHVVKG